MYVCIYYIHMSAKPGRTACHSAHLSCHMGFAWGGPFFRWTWRKCFQRKIGPPVDAFCTTWCLAWWLRIGILQMSKLGMEQIQTEDGWKWFQQCLGDVQMAHFTTPVCPIIGMHKETTAWVHQLVASASLTAWYWHGKCWTLWSWFCWNIAQVSRIPGDGAH